MKRALIYAGFALSALLLWLVARNLEWARAAATLRTLKGGFFLVSLVFFLLTIFFRAVRWRYLLKAQSLVPVPALVSATSIGLMVNNILPVRLGDLVRAYLIGKRAEVSGVTALATLVVERILDIVCLLSILGFYLIFSPRGQSALTGRKVGAVEWAFLVALALGIVAIYLAQRAHARVDSFVQRILAPRFPHLSHKFLELFHQALAGFTAVRGVPQLLRVILFTFCLWLAGATSYFYLMEAFSFPLGYTSGLLVLVFVTFGVAFPSAPGYVGTYHAFCVLGLTVAGLGDRTVAASYAFTLHAMEWTSSTALGFYFLWREGLSLKALRQQV